MAKERERKVHYIQEKNSSGPQRDRGSKRLIFRRTVIMMVLCGVVMFIPLIGQLWNISVTMHEEYSQIASRQQTKAVAVSASRGAILDRNGNVLAMSATVYKLILSPLDVIESIDEKQYVNEDGKLDETAYQAAIEARRKELIDGLCVLLGDSVSLEKLEKHMGRTNSQYEVLMTNIEKDLADAIRVFLTEHKCRNDLWITPDTKRYYPYSDLASHVVGFVNSEGGAYGIEAALDEILKGKAGRVVTTKTANGTEMYNSYSEYVGAEDGYNVTLTIDSTIQAFAEKALEQGIKAFDVQYGGFCIVMDPNTGEIFAMASSPDYDLNQYGTVQDLILNDQIPGLTSQYLQSYQSSPDYVGKTQEELEGLARSSAINEMLGTQWKSQAYQDTYEPGSTFKALVLAAALEEGAVSGSDTFYCPGYYVVNGTRINCSKKTGHGSQTLAEAVENSCNPAFMQIGQKLGAEKFYDYFEAFGMTSATGIEMAGEGKGIVWDRDYVTSAEGYLSLATMSFGQRFTVTPLQMITGFAATINGGNLVTPHVVKSVSGQDGNAIATTETQVVRQVVSQEISDLCREILEGVVGNPGGTGKKAYVAGYRIGGKTGTSETSVKGEVIVSFMGFAPADNPRIIVLLGYNVPKRVSEGSSYSTTGVYISGGNMPTTMAGPLIAEVLDYLGVEKVYTENEAQLADVKMPSAINLTVEQAASALGERNLSYRTIGDGTTVTAQIPAAGAAIPGGSTVILYLGGEAPEGTAMVPDVTGLSYAAAKDKLEAAGFFIRAAGASSYSTATKVLGQSVAGGEVAALGAVINVQMETSQVEDGLVTGAW